MRVIRYICTYAVFFAFMYFGLYEGIDGARNVLMGYAWFVFAISLLSLTNPMIELFREKGRVIPNYIDVPIDIIIAGAFIWFGMFWTGAAFVVHVFMVEAGMQEALKTETVEGE